MMVCVRWDLYELPGAQLMKFAIDSDTCMSLDDIDDLVARVQIFGTGIATRRDRHGGDLRIFCLAEYGEEVAFMISDIVDLHTRQW